MKAQRLIIIISLILAYLFMSGGYSIWQKKIVIKGNIEVVEPQPEQVEANEAPMLNITNSFSSGDLVTSDSPDSISTELSDPK